MRSGGARRGRAALLALLVVGGLAVIAAAVGRGATEESARAKRACTPPPPGAAYTARIERALRAGRDVWGDRLLKSRRGPTYEGVRRYLRPLLLADATGDRSVSTSGVHYLPFTRPKSPRGAVTVALHVADGSEIVSEHARGERLAIGVGRGGRERYGECLRRLAEPRLAEGWLPILRTRYVDSAGVRYRQESFAARVQRVRGLVSFVRLRVDARKARARVTIRFRPSSRRLAARDGRLMRGAKTVLHYSEGGGFDGSSLRFVVRPGEVRTLYVAKLNTPGRSGLRAPDRAQHDRARDSAVRYWEGELAKAGVLVVPERRVLDAQRSVLMQQLGLGWRYSVGNRYEQVSPRETLDAARLMAAFGRLEQSREILRIALRADSTRRWNARMGSFLVAAADHAWLLGDTTPIAKARRRLLRYLDGVERQLASTEHRLLEKEGFSTDIGQWVYGLHTQTVVWQGLRRMSAVWRRVGNVHAARRSARLADRLERGLRAAIRASRTRLAPGKVFVAVRLHEHERPYRLLHSTRSGSYWNFVMPYALSSGFFSPSEAAALYRYMSAHGAWLLGLPRTWARPLYPRSAGRRAGVNPAYGLHVARYLASTDRADQLVLALYGHLAAAMTPTTYVAGEATSISPRRGEHHRITYLPPNLASNASFLETLRLTLVSEAWDRGGRPRGLRLAHATPRAWLAPGKRIEARDMPSSFGRVSLTMVSRRTRIDASVVLRSRPGRLRAATPRSLRVRFRVPRGTRITSVRLAGRRLRFDEQGTVELPSRRGRFELVVRVRR